MTEVQKEFLEIINYFNEVIMNNNLVISKRLEEQFKKDEPEYQSTEHNKQLISCPWSEDEFYKYIFKKIKDIQINLTIYDKKLTYFYIYYKRVYDGCSITLIVLSSTLTLVEGISLLYEPIIYTTMATMIMGMLIGVLTSVLKFFNYKAETEEIIKMKERVYNCNAKIYLFDKHLKSTLYLQNNEIQVKPELTSGVILKDDDI